jgi:hypothetical protein
MAKLWSVQPLLFASVQTDRWVENGQQGLVWLPDLRPHDAALDEMAGEAEVAFLPRKLPGLFRKKCGHSLREALPYVCEIYGPHWAAATIPGASRRARELGCLGHLRFHSLPFMAEARALRLFVLAVCSAAWLTLPRALKLRCVVCALLYSFAELSFTRLERGKAYTSLAQYDIRNRSSDSHACLS